MADAFGPIAPAPVVDSFVFDFTAQIAGSGTIASAVWVCAVDPTSPVPDPNAAACIVGPPTFSANATSALVGNMVDGCLYDLTATVTMSDARVLTDSATLQCTSVEVPPQVFPLTIAQFRALFTAFSDTSAYSDIVVQAYLNLAATFVNCAWGPMQGFGQGLWAAHELAKMGPTGAGNPANDPSGISGIINSKSVGPVSVGYDTSIGQIDGAGSYNLTVYGRQYYQLMKVFGMGPFQFGPPEPVPVGSQVPWVGPPPYLGYDW